MFKVLKYLLSVSPIVDILIGAYKEIVQQIKGVLK